jgi:SPP1 family predicted phage head-tail adaptor
MNAGRLRHRITIQEPVTARNGYGEAITTWTAVATVWASVEPLSGREYFAAEHVQSEVTHRVRMRWQSGITPDMRVLFNGRVLKIDAVINYGERRTDLQLMCQEVAA